MTSPLLPPAAAWVDGRWVTGDATLQVADPARSTGICELSGPGAAGADEAVSVARIRHRAGVWSRLTPADRSGVLLALASSLEAHGEEIARLETLETGSPLSLRRAVDVAGSAAALRWFAGVARSLDGVAAGEYVAGHTSMLRREPVGVVVGLAPWNHPLLMAIWKVGAALAAGNSVVLKPAPQTPLTALALGPLAAAAGVPDGVLNIVAGDHTVGEALVTHSEVDMVSLTGGTGTGRRVQQLAATHVARTHLELGGKSPLLVFDDADLDRALAAVVEFGFFNAGQDCTAPSRVYVQTKVYDQFVTRLAERLERMRVGDPFGEVDQGSLIDHAQRDRVDAVVRRARERGALPLVGGHAVAPAGLEDGAFYAPTLYAGLPADSPVVREEIFGPVVSAHPFEDDDEALALANDSEYALSAGVFTRRIDRAMRLARDLEAGAVSLNSYGQGAHEMPHGGFKQSGHGSDLSRYGFEEFTRLKHVLIDLGEDAG